MQTEHFPDIVIADLEKYLSQYGNFCLLDWLLNQNIIAYGDYEQWRYGQITQLIDTLAIPSKALQNLFEKSHKLCQKLGLQAQEQDLHAWKKNQRQTLKLSSDNKVHQAISERWMRAQDIPQMDLFMDNSSVINENNLQSALAARDFSSAQKSLEQLTSLNAKHPKLGEYRDLILYGQHMAKQQHIELSTIESELKGLQEEVAPLAKEILGANSRDYLAFAWRRLSENLQDIKRDELNSTLHPAYCLCQIPDWQAAYSLLKNDSQLVQSFFLLDLYAQCCEALQLDNENRLAWSKLFELDVDKAETLIESKISIHMWNLWQDFWEAFEDSSPEYFSVYIMMKQAAVIHAEHAKFAFTSDLNKTCLIALQKELVDKDKVAARAQVQEVDKELLKMFVQVRR